MNHTREASALAAVYLGLTALTLAAYLPVLDNDFIRNYDDAQYVLENPHVHQGMTSESVVWAFTKTYAGNWHPLTWISHMIDYRLFESVIAQAERF